MWVLPSLALTDFTHPFPKALFESPFIVLLLFYKFFDTGYKMSALNPKRNISDGQRDFEFAHNWKRFTRTMSTVHAIVVSSLALRMIWVYGNALQNWDFCEVYPTGCEEAFTIYKIMLAYLLNDALYLYLNQVERDYLLTLAHHLVGGASMYMFIVTERVHYNGIYYALTELSTIPLNIAWFLIHRKGSTTESGKFVIMFFGFLTLINFLFVRIIGSFYQLVYLFRIRNHILHLMPPWGVIFAIGGNGTLTILNFYWFWLLLNAVFGFSSKVSVPTNDEPEPDKIKTE